MDPIEKIERGLDKRVDKPDHIDSRRRRWPSTFPKDGQVKHRMVLIENANRTKAVRQKIKQVLRETGCPFRPAFVDKSQPRTNHSSLPSYVAMPPITQQQRICFPMPAENSGSVPLLRMGQSRDYAYRAPSESFGELTWLIGDERVLFSVPMLNLRIDRPYLTKYPDDWRWYSDPGKTWHIYLSWSAHRRLNETYLDSSEAHAVAQLQRELQKESKELQVQEAKKHARVRIPEESDDEDTIEGEDERDYSDEEGNEETDHIRP